MLEPLPDLPDGVIGFRATGDLRASDYRDVLMPAVEAAVGKGEVRLVLVFEEWLGMSGGAMWQDLKFGVEHLTKWKKIALVTDVEWMTHLTHLFGWMSPGESKVFPLAELDDAIAWTAEA